MTHYYYFAILLLGCFVVTTKSFHNNIDANPSYRFTTASKRTTFLVKTKVKDNEEEVLQKQQQQQQQPDNEQQNKKKTIVSILLWISYDGGRFTGWSCTTKEEEDIEKQQSNRRQREKGKGFVRSVQYTLRNRLAKVYGNLPTDQIVVEGTSRTDKGVHAQMMVAQIYGLTAHWNETNTNNNTTVSLSIPGKVLPHPTGTYDDNHEVFLPLPKQDPSNLVFVLNRILPHDVSIRGYQLIPSSSSSSDDDSEIIPFHPSLNAITKTYEYAISLGPIHDPTQWRSTWHIPTLEKNWNVTRVEQACQFLTSSKSFDFAAFRGTVRGGGDSSDPSQNTHCSLHQVSITKIPHDVSTKNAVGCPPLTTRYCISITGNRFLYKMVRFLVGALVDIGRDRLTLEEFQHAVIHQSFENKNRRPECAPAHGLSLVDIDFGGDAIDRNSWKT